VLQMRSLIKIKKQIVLTRLFETTPRENTMKIEEVTRSQWMHLFLDGDHMDTRLRTRREGEIWFQNQFSSSIGRRGRPYSTRSTDLVETGKSHHPKGGGTVVSFSISFVKIFHQV